MVSAAIQARRALVKLLLALASVYSVVVDLNRDSCDSDVQKGFKKVFLKAYLDKGGSEQHAKQLNEAKDLWDKAKKAPHRPKEAGSHRAPKAERQEKAEEAEFVDLVAGEEQAKQPYRIQSQGVLLSYFRVEGLTQWRRFVDHVTAHQRQWKVKHWSATLERTKTGRLHIHLVLQ